MKQKNNKWRTLFGVLLVAGFFMTIGNEVYIGGQESTPLAELSMARTANQMQKGAAFSPKFVAAHEAKIENEDFVLGFEAQGMAHAYPISIMNDYKVVNDTLGDQKIVVTYCPLCKTGIVFSRIVEEKELTFNNTGMIFESAIVLYDQETKSYWSHVRGEAIQGELKGKELTVLPSTITTFAEWKELHPETTVLSDKM